MHQEMETVRSEKVALQVEVLTNQEEISALRPRSRLASGVQQAYDELRQHPGRGRATGKIARPGPDGQRRRP